MLHTLNFEECQFFTRIQKHHRRTLQNFMLQECQLKFLIPSRKCQTLGNDYSATKKSLQAHLPQQEQSNNEICYRPAERNCFTVLANSARTSSYLACLAQPQTKPGACRSWGNCSQQAVTTSNESEAFSEQLCERRPKLLRKRPPLS